MRKPRLASVESPHRRGRERQGTLCRRSRDLVEWPLLLTGHLPRPQGGDARISAVAHWAIPGSCPARRGRPALAGSNNRSERPGTWRPRVRPPSAGVTHVRVIRPASGIRPHASRRHPSDLALQRGREDASCPRNGRWDAKLSPPLSPCRCTVTLKIAICRDEEGERRDSNPQPPGPQPAPTSTSEAYTALSGDLSCSQLS